MIETETIWEDSGFDCSHCGGVILKRIDRETGLPDRVLLQCRECSCQWDLRGQLARVGKGPCCKTAAPAPKAEFNMRDVSDWVGLLSRKLWILLAIIGGVILLRFGGGMVARYLLPAVAIGAGLYALVRYGQKQSWW